MLPGELDQRLSSLTQGKQYNEETELWILNPKLRFPLSKRVASNS